MPNALDGYCPVELRENAKWTTGRSEFRATYQGHAYYFSTAAAMKQFTAAPEKYAPAQGGNDAVLAMEEDRVVPGSIQHSAVWRGQLYLFASAANLAAFREDPARYAKRPRSLEEPQQSHGPATEDEPAPQPDSRPPAEPKALPQLQLPGDSL